MSMNEFPSRKISETLLDFAQPLIAMIDTHTTEEQLRQGFVIAVTIWNAFVFDKARECTQYGEMLNHALGDLWTSLPVLKALVERRQRLFADDMRAISDFRVRFADGELRAWAQARRPYVTPLT
jgi:hypothetical protein